jgi:hypothetical protein
MGTAPHLLDRDAAGQDIRNQIGASSPPLTSVQKISRDGDHKQGLLSSTASVPFRPQSPLLMFLD